MIAEIKGKISGTYSNFSDRMEDELTGNIFGNLRYLPFNKGLKKILCDSVSSTELCKIIDCINKEYWADTISFWPYHKNGEIDVKIDFPEIVIGIEVKYLSGLSSDDEVSNVVGKDEGEEFIESDNQLSRESRMLKQWGIEKKKVLLFLADQQYCHTVYEYVKSRNIIEDGVNFGYFTWQSVLKALKALSDLNDFEKVIINDLIELLQRKDFEPFDGFYIENIIETSLRWEFSTEKKSMTRMSEFNGFYSPNSISKNLLWKY